MDSTLDRAPVEIDSGKDGENGRMLHTTDVSTHSSSASPMHLSKKRRLKRKAKVMLHIDDSSTAIPEPGKGVTLAPTPAPAAFPSRLDDSPPKEGLHGVKDLAHQPVQTIKARAGRATNRKVAKNVATGEISHAHDVELVMAQDRMNAASTEEERSSAYHDLDMLKKARQDMFVRWTMDRHVLKIRQLDRKPIPARSRAEFTTEDQSGHVKIGWIAYSHHLALRFSEKYGGQYIGSFANPPPATKETISASIEKLLVASTPWQEIIMHMRRIYRWDNTQETLIYLVIFLFLWAINCVASTILLAMIVQVLRQRLYPRTVEGLRKDIARTEDPMLTALTLVEQIEKRGEHGWIEPLVEDIGPWLLVQLVDLSNLLEVILNFQEWRQPHQTAYTLSYLSIACFAFCVTPSWLLVKVITLGAGLVFFGLFPIGSHFPDYRLLASPSKWLFWNIPNHAEWAISRLQIEGARHKSRGPQYEKPVDPSIKDAASSKNQDILVAHGSYKCINGKHSGKLLVTSQGVRFETTIGYKNEWEICYDDIHLLQKVNRIVKVGAGQDLLFIDKHGKEFALADVAQRDEVFTQIIGYSSVKWQVLG